MSGKNKKAAQSSSESLPTGSGKVGKTDLPCKVKVIPQVPSELAIKIVDRGDSTHLFCRAIVTATGPSPSTAAVNQPSGDDGIANFGIVSPGQYQISYTLNGTDAPDFVTSKPFWTLSVGPDRNLKTVSAEPVNAVSPKLELISTETDQFLEASTTETAPALHAYAQPGALSSDPVGVTLTFNAAAFAGSIPASELTAKKKLTLTSTTAGVYTFTLDLADPADRFVVRRNNPATAVATKTTIAVLHEKDSQPVPDLSLVLKLGGSACTVKTAVPPVIRWMIPGASELTAITYTDPEDYFWEFVDITSS